MQLSFKRCRSSACLTNAYEFILSQIQIVQRRDIRDHSYVNEQLVQGPGCRVLTRSGCLCCRCKRTCMEGRGRHARQRRRLYAHIRSTGPCSGSQQQHTAWRQQEQAAAERAAGQGAAAAAAGTLFRSECQLMFHCSIGTMYIILGCFYSDAACASEGLALHARHGWSLTGPCRGCSLAEL